jgi:predicted nuclease of predicted toxin-antitoxin system
VAVRIKVDEDLPCAVAEVLRAAGHDVWRVTEQGWSGWKDDSLWNAIRSEGRLFVTADKGFADLRRLGRSAKESGIVLLRVDRECSREYTALARRLLDTFDLERLVGALVVVTEQGIRLRRP